MTTKQPLHNTHSLTRGRTDRPLQLRFSTFNADDVNRRFLV